jgi:hypothetical protein
MVVTAPFSFTREDEIPAELTAYLSLQKIQERNIMWRWFWRLYREIVLLRAARGSSLGQGSDLQPLQNMFSNNGGMSSADCILIGHSNGAAIGLNIMQQIPFRGSVFFAPPCHGGLAFRGFPPIASLPRTWFFETYVIPALRWIALPKYNDNCMQPILLGKSVCNKHTPMLIVSIKNDHIVHQFHHIALYIALREVGYDVYFYEVENGDHQYIMTKAQQKNDPQGYQDLQDTVQGFLNYVRGVGTLPISLLEQKRSSQFLVEMYRRFHDAYGDTYGQFAREYVL